MLASLDASILGRMSVRDWALGLGALALMAACRAQMLGDPANPRPQGTRDGDTRPDVGVVGTPLDGGLSSSCPSGCCSFVPPNCPPTAPTPGTPCGAPSSYRCEYGDDPFSGCNTVVTCTASGWTLQQTFSTPATGCPTTEPSCPSSFGSAADGGIGCPYDDPNLICAYPEGFCVCNGGWDCSPVPNDCPTTRPRAGTACDSDGGGCQNWGRPCTGNAMLCECGVWLPVICIELGG